MYHVFLYHHLMTEKHTGHIHGCQLGLSENAGSDLGKAGVGGEQRKREA